MVVIFSNENKEAFKRFYEFKYELEIRYFKSSEI